VRRWLAARRAAAVAAVKRQMAEMASLLREYQRRTAAALRIQVGGRASVHCTGGRQYNRTARVEFVACRAGLLC
jgi:hypothetical protein